MSDVFISYAREDRPRADQIAHALQGLGLEVFWDTEIPPGQTWSDYIEGKLSQSKVVVVLWSQHSTKSQWVREEARMGRDKSKLIPAILDGSPAPLGFGEVQAADLTNWTGDLNDPAWRRFAAAAYGIARDGAALPQTASQSPPRAAYVPPPAAPHAAAPHAAAAPESATAFGYIQKCLRLYVDGKGRARRAEYWWWALFSFVVYILAYLLDVMAFGLNAMTNAPNTQAFYIIAFLGLLAPTIAVMSRRFHDVGLNGWLVAGVWGLYFVGAMLIAAAIPFGAVLIGALMLCVLVVLLIPSRPGDNKYGPNPKGA